MYRSFEARNFRCFRDLTINDLERVNLIAGINNVGKTALLEALFLHCGGYNPELTIRLNAFRGIETMKFESGEWIETPWDSLFADFDASKKIELAGVDEATGHRSLSLEIVHKAEELVELSQFLRHVPDRPERLPLSSKGIQVLRLVYKENERKTGKYYMIFDLNGLRAVPIPPPPPFQAFFLTARTRIPLQEDAERFGRLELMGRQEALLKALRVIEPRLRRLAVVVAGGVPIIHGDIGLNRLVPLPVMGEGMTRLATLVLAVANAPNGVVLIDEIENGLHHTILPQVWRAIGETARDFDTQVFATTHSLECITAAHRAFAESGLYDFRLLRLERRGAAIQAVNYDRETLEAALRTGLEVR